MSDMNAAEMAVIGCLIMVNEAQGQILSEVSEEDFTSQQLADLYGKLGALWNKLGKLDAVVVSSLPPAEKELAVACAEAPIAYSNWPVYCKAVRERAMILRAQELGLKLATGDLTMDEASDIANALNAALAGRRGVISEGSAQGIIGFIKRQCSGAPNYIKTGFSRMDRYTAFSPGDMVIIGARPSAGKTAFSIQLALNMAKAGKRVVYYSLETSAQKIMDRAITCFYGLDFQTVKEHKVYEGDQGEFVLDPDAFGKLPFEVIEASGRTVQWIRADAVRRKADVCMIDYLGLIRGKGNGRYEIVTQISQDIHAAAQETKMLFVVLSQLNRAGEGSVPNVSDLRESGQVEQDGDCIMLLHYADRDTGEYVVRIGKNKDGLVGDLKFNFEGAKQRFWEVDNGRTC